MTLPAYLSWIKHKIHQQWEESLPDRYDPARARKDVNADGVIENYENSYEMAGKSAEATASEVKELMTRYKKAEAGLIRWDEQRQELYEIDPRQE